MTRPSVIATAGTAFALGAALVLATAAPPVRAATPDEAAAVNVAGRQRMLSQRIVKAYCAAGLGVVAPRARRQLADALDLFERQLAMLRALDLDDDARRTLRQVEERWRMLEPVARDEVGREHASTLARHADELLNASHRLVLHLEESAASPLARLVNLSGRQRMLSQRVASLYFRRAWGLGDAAQDEALRLATAEFTAGLQALSAAPQSTPEILEELAAVHLQWTWFEYALGLEGARSWLLVVDDASESILNSMDAITAMYESLAER